MSMSSPTTSERQINKMPINKEPHFFVNDFLAESDKLRDVLTELKSKPKHLEKSEFLKKFANEMFRAYRKNKKLWAAQEKKETLEELKEAEQETETLKNLIKNRKKTKEALKAELLKKKEELMQKISTLKPTQESTDFTPLKKTTKEPIPNIGLHPNINLEKTLPTPISSPFEIEEPITIKKEEVIDELKEAMHEKENLEYAISEKPTEKEEESEKPKKEGFFSRILHHSKSEPKENNKLTGLLNNPAITEIICDGPDQSLKVVEDKKEKLLPIKLTKDEINSFIKETAKNAKQEISNETPFLMTEYNKMEIQATLGTETTTAKLIIKK